MGPMAPQCGRSQTAVEHIAGKRRDSTARHHGIHTSCCGTSSPAFRSHAKFASTWAVQRKRCNVAAQAWREKVYHSAAKNCCAPISNCCFRSWPSAILTTCARALRHKRRPIFRPGAMARVRSAARFIACAQWRAIRTCSLQFHDGRRSRTGWRNSSRSDVDAILCPISPVPAFEHLRKLLPLERTLDVDGTTVSNT